MEEEKAWWAPAVGAGILAVLLGSIALVAAGGWAWFSAFLAGQAAGWAQAIGALVAIGVAYRMARVQIHADRVMEAERRAEDDLRRIAVIDALFSNTQALCRTYKDAWERSGYPGLGPINKGWADCRASIASINPFDSPDAAVVIFLAKLPRQIDHLIEAHYELRAGTRHEEGRVLSREVFDRLRQQLDETLAMLEEARTECAAAAMKISAKVRR